MAALFWAAIVVVLASLVLGAYVLGYRAGHDDTESAYIDALDWLATEHDRRMRGA